MKQEACRCSSRWTIPVIDAGFAAPRRMCADRPARAARPGGPRGLLAGCTKSDHGLVALDAARSSGCRLAPAARQAAQMGARFEGVIVARMAPRPRDGARRPRRSAVRAGRARWGRRDLPGTLELSLLLPALCARGRGAGLGELSSSAAGCCPGREAAGRRGVCGDGSPPGRCHPRLAGRRRIVDVNPVILFETVGARLRSIALIERSRGNRGSTAAARYNRRPTSGGTVSMKVSVSISTSSTST